MHPLTLFLFAAHLPAVWLVDLKALDEFVNLPDPHYEYTLVKKWTYSLVYFNFIFHHINMTSQKWLDESEVDKPVWSHELMIMKKEGRKVLDSCLLMINSGLTYTSSSFVNIDRQLMVLGALPHSIVAVLSSVPSQPLTFYKHPLGYENITGYDLMAYSWWRFINDSSVPPEWLVQFPMVKVRFLYVDHLLLSKEVRGSGHCACNWTACTLIQWKRVPPGCFLATVRAMDTITDYMMKTYRYSITNFTLAGDSVAGWATWLTAAVDSRAVRIIPISMDFLNFTENFRHHYAAYCGWSYGLKPLYDMNITQKLNYSRFKQLASHVDPLAYNDRYTSVSEHIIIPSGDEVFQLDNSHYYFSQLEGQKFLNIIPNVDNRFQGNLTLVHLVKTSYKFFIDDSDYPRISWERTMTNTTGIIHFYAAREPGKIYSYHADTVRGTRRDFRMKIAAGDSSKDNPIKWTQTNVEKVSRYNYKKEMEIPAEGWRGFFIQAIYTDYETPVHITSEIHIIPDTFPCPDGCRGALV